MIEYRRDSPSTWGKASGVTVNGKPWDDVSVPFQLGFTPDLTRARLVEKEGRGPVFVTKNYDGQFDVFVNDWEMGASDYMFKVAVAPAAPSVQKEPTKRPASEHESSENEPSSGESDP